VIERSPRSTHYIAFCDGIIYDSAFDVPFGVTHYPDKDSCVQAVFTRCPIDQLSANWPVRP
jgi:hypothetical protein